MQRTDLVSVHPTPPMSLEGLSAAHELADDIVRGRDEPAWIAAQVQHHPHRTRETALQSGRELAGRVRCELINADVQHVVADCGGSHSGHLDLGPSHRQSHRLYTPKDRDRDLASLRPLDQSGRLVGGDSLDVFVADLDDLITTFQPCRGGGRSRHGPGDHRVGAAEAQIDSDSGVLALVALLQAFVLFGVEVDREWIAETVDQALHGALRQLLGVDAAVDIIGLDQSRRLLDLSQIDTRSGSMSDVRDVLWIRLVEIDSREESDEHQQRHGATPQGDAAIHVSRLMSQQPSQMQGSL